MNQLPSYVIHPNSQVKSQAIQLANYAIVDLPNVELQAFHKKLSTN